MDVSKSFCHGEQNFSKKDKKGMHGVLCKNISQANLKPSQYLLEILQTSLTGKNSEYLVKSGCFKKFLQWATQIVFWNEGGMLGVLCKYLFLADLLGSLYLLEMLKSSITVKNNENVVKSGCFEKLLRWREPT